MAYYTTFRSLLAYIYAVLFKPIFDLFNGEQTRQTIIPGGAKPTSEIPGPKSWPFLGDAASLSKFGGPEKFLEYVSQLHATYGNIVKTQLGPQKFIFVNSPALYKEIARHEPRCPASFKLPASVAFDAKYKTPRGLFFQDGEEWYKGRALITQLLLKGTGEFMGPVFQPVEEILENVISDWSSKCLQNDDGLITSIEQDCYEFFISSISAITYGRNYKEYLTLAGTNVSKLATISIKLNASTFNLNAYPIGIATLFGLNCWKEYEEFTKYNLQSGRKCTDAALEAMKLAENGGSIEEFGLLHRLKNTCKASDQDIRTHCTDFTVDISDPVSITTLWTMYAMGRNPNVQVKILSEIESVFGTSQHPVSYEDLEKLPYLHRVLKEVLRLYPTAVMAIRNPKEDVVIDGYNITSDHILALSAFESHKNPNYFSDPEKLWPERWLGEIENEIDPATGNRLKCEEAYLPFGIGKRTCPGKLIVLSLVKLLLAKVVQNFTVETTEVKRKLKIILYPDGDMKLRLIPRSNKKTN